MAGGQSGPDHLSVLPCLQEGERQREKERERECACVHFFFAGLRIKSSNHSGNLHNTEEWRKEHEASSCKRLLHKTDKFSVAGGIARSRHERKSAMPRRQGWVYLFGPDHRCHHDTTNTATTTATTAYRHHYDESSAAPLLIMPMLHILVMLLLLPLLVVLLQCCYYYYYYCYQ